MVVVLLGRLRRRRRGCPVRERGEPEGNGDGVQAVRGGGLIRRMAPSERKAEQAAQRRRRRRSLGQTEKQTSRALESSSWWKRTNCLPPGVSQGSRHRATPTKEERRVCLRVNERATELASQPARIRKGRQANIVRERREENLARSLASRGRRRLDAERKKWQRQHSIRMFPKRINEQRLIAFSSHLRDNTSQPACLQRVGHHRATMTERASEQVAAQPCGKT